MDIYTSSLYSNKCSTISKLFVTSKKSGLFIQIILTFIITSCESNTYFYRPDLPEQLCAVGIIDADDTISFNYKNPYSHHNYLRNIYFEKSFQSEYSEDRDDSLRNLSFSISTQNGEIFSYQCDSILKNLRSYKLPANLNFIQGEKYFMKAHIDGLDDISAEINVPASPSNLVLHSVHKETKPAIQEPGCHFDLDDSIKYAIIDLSFDVLNDSYYAVLLEGVGTDVRYHYGTLGFLDFSVKNNIYQGFNAIIYGLKMSHLNCSGSERSITQSRVKAFFIDSNNVKGKRCNIILSAKFNDSYSIFFMFTSFRIKLLSIPKELYLFEKSLYTYEKVAEDPFAEPMYLNGNIKNGNGIFAICRSSEVIVNLPFPPFFK